MSFFRGDLPRLAGHFESGLAFRGSRPLSKREALRGVFHLHGHGFFLGGASFGHFVVFPYATHFLTTFGEESIGIPSHGLSSVRLLQQVHPGDGIGLRDPDLRVRVGEDWPSDAPGFLWAKFKYAVLLIFVAAAIITPTPDVVTQSLLAISNDRAPTYYL